MNIVQFIKSELCKGIFREGLGSWTLWIVIWKGLFGLRMTKKELSLWHKITGERKPPKKPFREIWASIGRRGGKTFFACFTIVFLALFYNFQKYLIAGEIGTVLLIAPDRPTARIALRYILGILHSHPVLEAYIERESRESILLTNNISIEVVTCSYRLVRGRTVVACVMDEVSFWRDENSANPDAEVLAAVRPSMSTIPQSMLLVISTPYARSGIHFEHISTYFGKDDPDILAVKAATREANPTISQAFIDKEVAKDPAAARCEYYIEPREDIEGYLSLDAARRSIVPGRIELPFSKDHEYFFFADMSGGRRDSGALAGGHYDYERKLLVVDVLAEYPAPHNPREVVHEMAKIITERGADTVVGDKYGGDFPVAMFDEHGVFYETCDRGKSELYLNLAPYLNSGKIELLDHPKLLTQLTSLERRRGRSGRDIIDHPPRGHDDLANVIAGLCYLLSREEESYGDSGIRLLDMPDKGYWFRIW